MSKNIKGIKTREDIIVSDKIYMLEPLTENVNLYCYNCRKYGHGFKRCNLPLITCKRCRMSGHTYSSCKEFNSKCYRCLQHGIILPRKECKEHKRVITCGGIIFDRSMEYIVIVLGKYSQKWGLPKGCLEKGESYAECAMREIKEETGLSLDIKERDAKIRINRIHYYPVIINYTHKKKSYKEILKSINNYLNDNDEINDKPPKFTINDKHEILKVQWIKLSDINDLHSNKSLKMLPHKLNTILKILKDKALEYL
jgi:ADP-ribose pyrophosphatase YjhB (NUDIX family)